MSSYYKRQKDYAKELLNKHVSNFYKDDTVELKYSIISNKGMRKVDDKLIDYLSKETGLTSIQATDLVLSQYDEAKKKYDKMKKYHGYKKDDYTDRYRKATKKVYDKTIDSRVKLYNAIDKINMGVERKNYFSKNLIDKETNRLIIENNNIGGFNVFTEEELLEAVDILVEDYGLDEEEAIEMIAETYEMELYDTLCEDYGIFEDEYGDLFIESEMVEYVMDEYDLYEEDAIDLIMEAFEEELLDEGKKAVIGGGLAATAIGGVAYKAYRDSKHRVNRKAKGVEKAAKKVRREQEIRRTMDDVEKTRVRKDYRMVPVPNGNGGTVMMPVRNSGYDDARAIVKERESADKRVLKAKKRFNRKANSYNKAVDHYNAVQERRCK